MSTYNQHNNFEALRLRSPEFLTNHRQVTIANAIRNLSAHASIETIAPEVTPVHPQEAPIQTPVISEEITREAAQFKQDTSVGRIMQNVDAIYEGQGNPLYDKEAL